MGASRVMTRFADGEMAKWRNGEMTNGRIARHARGGSAMA
jgi:hypothetical protein